MELSWTIIFLFRSCRSRRFHSTSLLILCLVWVINYRDVITIYCHLIDILFVKHLLVLWVHLSHMFTLWTQVVIRIRILETYLTMSPIYEHVSMFLLEKYMNVHYISSWSKFIGTCIWKPFSFRSWCCFPNHTSIGFNCISFCYNVSKICI